MHRRTTVIKENVPQHASPFVVPKHVFMSILGCLVYHAGCCENLILNVTLCALSHSSSQYLTIRSRCEIVGFRMINKLKLLSTFSLSALFATSNLALFSRV